MKTLRNSLLASFGACLLLHAAPPADLPTTDPALSPPPFVKVAEVEGRNLLTNGSFDKGTTGWELFNWGKRTRMRIDPGELHDGHPALRVDNLAIGHSFVRQVLPGKPHTRYLLSGYIKTRNIEPSINTQTSGAILMAGRLGAYTALLAGTQPWTKVSVEFTTTDDSTLRVGPSIGTDSSFCNGTAWFADLRLTELGASERFLHAERARPHFLDPSPASLIAFAVR